jgi:uncharacterized GH25 family protein
VKRGLWRAAVFAALCLAASQGHSHDSWLSPSRSVSPPGEVRLELATGNRYPLQEFSQSAASVAQARCTDGAVTTPLRPLVEESKWLDLGASILEGRGKALACWAELAPAEIEIQPRLVQVYFADIHTSAANRQAWAALQARGLPWRESYRKFARIELAQAADVPAQRLAAARRPVGLDLEIVVSSDNPIAVGEPLAFQVLRDGRPLAGFPVELVSERSPLGIWRETDADGMLHHSLPFAGRWLLRGTDLRLSTQRADTWESRFVTLAVEAR